MQSTCYLHSILTLFPCSPMLFTCPHAVLLSHVVSMLSPHCPHTTPMLFPCPPKQSLQCPHVVLISLALYHVHTVQIPCHAVPTLSPHCPHTDTHSPSLSPCYPPLFLIVSHCSHTVALCTPHCPHSTPTWSSRALWRLMKGPGHSLPAGEVDLLLSGGAEADHRP